MSESTLEYRAENVQRAVNAILKVLGEPVTPLHVSALEAFQQQDEEQIKYLAAAHLNDGYCTTLSYCISALKLSAETATILADAGRAAADFARDRALWDLSWAISVALKPRMEEF